MTTTDNVTNVTTTPFTPYYYSATAFLPTCYGQCGMLTNANKVQTIAILMKILERADSLSKEIIDLAEAKLIKTINSINV